MANSFKQMIDTKTIKRPNDGMYIRFHDLHIDKRYDKREDNERNRVADEELFEYLMSGGVVPPLEVRPRDEGGVWIVEGHRRTRSYEKCLKAGKPVEWIHVVPFTGNEIDRIARIATSNNQLSLTTSELAEVVRELLAFNLTPDEIARKIHKSRPTIDKLIVYLNASNEVQVMVKSGSVALDVATERVKEEGENAAITLAKDVVKARSLGKNKVTKSVATPKFKPAKSAKFIEIICENEIDVESDTIEVRLTTELRQLTSDYRVFKSSLIDHQED